MIELIEVRDMERRMMPLCSRLAFVTLLAFAATACQSEDTAPKPRFVSSGVADAAPLSTSAQSGPTAQSPQNNKQYFIEFRSRYALSYGHTYVIFGRLDKAGQMINPEVAGLHPASTAEVPYVLGHFVPVPAETGWSDGDLEDQYRSASWRVMLTQAEYNKVTTYIRKLQASSPLWHASLYNCNAFVADIAHSMGYKAPGIWLRPQQFVTKLREMNEGPNTTAYIAPAASSAN